VGPWKIRGVSTCGVRGMGAGRDKMNIKDEFEK